MVIEGHGTRYSVLKQANFEKADVVAAMTNHEAVNLFACKLAKKAGVPSTIARIRNPELTSPDYTLTLEELGADMLIHPEKETAELANVDYAPPLANRGGWLTNLFNWRQ